MASLSSSPPQVALGSASISFASERCSSTSASPSCPVVPSEPNILELTLSFPRASLEAVGAARLCVHDEKSNELARTQHGDGRMWQR